MLSDPAPKQGSNTFHLKEKHYDRRVLFFSKERCLVYKGVLDIPDNDALHISLMPRVGSSATERIIGSSKCRPLYQGFYAIFSSPFFSSDARGFVSLRSSINSARVALECDP